MIAAKILSEMVSPRESSRPGKLGVMRVWIELFGVEVLNMTVEDIKSGESGGTDTGVCSMLYLLGVMIECRFVRELLGTLIAHSFPIALGSIMERVCCRSGTNVTLDALICGVFDHRVG